MNAGDEDLVPSRQHDDDAAFDLHAATDLTLLPGTFKPVPTGLHLEMPGDFAAQVRPRSGLAAKNGITVLNSPGTIDAGFRGEVCAILINHGQEPFVIHRGDRIAQLLFEQLPPVKLVPAVELSATSRGNGGFGSTGV